MQEAQTGRRETENREARQIRQSEGNKAARRLFTASPTIRGACDFPFGMLSQLLLKTGLLLETSDPCRQFWSGIDFHYGLQLERPQYIPTSIPVSTRQRSLGFPFRATVKPNLIHPE
jgi:hypothetical protein